MKIGSIACVFATACAPAPSPQAPSPQGTPRPSVATPRPLAPQHPSPAETAPAPTAPAEAAPTTVCEASQVREQMLQALFADDEFRNYVCWDPCNEQTFAQQVSLRQELLREQPATWGCFAEPKRQATTGLFVLFLVQNGSVEWHLSYSGIYIGTKRGRPMTHGYADLEATERDYSTDTWLTHRFVWNGKGYVVESTKVAR